MIFYQREDSSPMRSLYSRAGRERVHFFELKHTSEFTETDKKNVRNYKRIAAFSLYEKKDSLQKLLITRPNNFQLPVAKNRFG